MTEGIRFALNEIESGRHDTSAEFQAVCWNRLPLFCIAGLVFVGLAHSTSAQSISLNVDAEISYAVSRGAMMSAVAAKKPEYDREPPQTQASASKTELKPAPNLGIGVEIVGGLALFLWIQRFRNY